MERESRPGRVRPGRALIERGEIGRRTYDEYGPYVRAINPRPKADVATTTMGMNPSSPRFGALLNSFATLVFSTSVIRPVLVDDLGLACKVVAQMGMMCINLAYSQAVENRMVGDLLSHALQKPPTASRSPRPVPEFAGNRKFRTEPDRRRCT